MSYATLFMLLLVLGGAACMALTLFDEFTAPKSLGRPSKLVRTDKKVQS